MCRKKGNEKKKKTTLTREPKKSAPFGMEGGSPTIDTLKNRNGREERIGIAPARSNTLEYRRLGFEGNLRTRV